MTPGCQVWVRDLLNREPTIVGEVLEIGALDVNGSIRGEFADADRFPGYIGTDMRDGPGVDRAVRADQLPFAAGRFGVVVCLEMLEHDSRFWLTLRECARVLARGGWFIGTTRAFTFPRHDYPYDYWRFSASGLREALAWAGFEAVDAVEDGADLGVFATARRVGGGSGRLRGFMSDDEIERLRGRMNALIPLGVTSIADAFDLVAAERRRLLDVVITAWRDGTTPDAAAAIGGVVEEVGDAGEEGLPVMLVD